MKKSFLAALVATLSLFVFILPIAACAKKHEAKTEWECNSEKHRHACTVCAEEVFDEGAHNFKTVDGVKKCEICGFERAFTDDEAYSLWRVGIAAALSYEGDYTLTYKRKETDGNGKLLLDRDCRQARSASNDFYSYNYDYEDYDNSGTLKESTREIVLASAADTTGILYNYHIKYYDETDEKFVEKNEEKTITQADLDEEAYMSPKGLCGENYFNLSAATTETTFDDFKKAYDKWIETLEEESMTVSLSVEVKSDGSVILYRETSYNYKDGDVTSEKYLYTTAVEKVGIIVKDGIFVGFTEIDTLIDVYIVTDGQNIDIHTDGGNAAKKIRSEEGLMSYSFDKAKFDELSKDYLK